MAWSPPWMPRTHETKKMIDEVIGMIEQRYAPQPCLSCDRMMDAFTDAYGDKSPTEGSITVCFYCSHIMMLTADLKYREPNSAELHHIAGDKKIIDVINAIKLTKKNMKWAPMKLLDIESESGLRAWLREFHHHMDDVELQWVEPSVMLGSSVGAADVIMKHGDLKIDVELKYLHPHRRGVKFTLRPSQRRFHHSSMRRGAKTALLYVESKTNGLYLVRGDKIPLRDYASDPDSGCAQGKVDQCRVDVFTDKGSIGNMAFILFDPSFWSGT
jgi:hypothetical protein